MKHIAYRHFQLPADLWAKHKPTADSKRISIVVAAALGAGDMVFIVGERGCGKTHSLWLALKTTDHKIVEPLRLDREKLHIGDIQSAIVMQLSDEKPRHSGEARAGQVRRLLASTRAVLVIDEAHLLHHQTLRSLKRLRELGARGKARQSLPIILAGQRDTTSAIPEVGLRTDVLSLSGLSKTEARNILTSLIGRCASPQVIELIAGSAAARNWLELRQLVDNCLAQSMSSGKKITIKAVRQVLGDIAEHSDPAPEVNAPLPGAVANALASKQNRERAA